MNVRDARRHQQNISIYLNTSHVRCSSLLLITPLLTPYQILPQEVKNGGRSNLIILIFVKKKMSSEKLAMAASLVRMNRNRKREEIKDMIRDGTAFSGINTNMDIESVTPQDIDD